MTFAQITLALDGLRKRDTMVEEWMRRMTSIIAATNFGGKGVANRMDKLWPSRIRKKDAGSAAKRALENHYKFLESKKQMNGRRS